MITDSIAAICKVLNECTVEYMIVGGTAVAFHGYFRESTIGGKITEKPDLDFWYNPTYENYFKLLNALEILGRDVSQFKRELAPNPNKSFFRYDFKEFTLDFLPQIKAILKFSLSFEKREIVNIAGVEIPFISYDDLIADKQANARAKDIADIEHLKMNNKPGN